MNVTLCTYTLISRMEQLHLFVLQTILRIVMTPMTKSSQESKSFQGCLLCSNIIRYRSMNLIHSVDKLEDKVLESKLILNDILIVVSDISELKTGNFSQQEWKPGNRSVLWWRRQRSWLVLLQVTQVFGGARRSSWVQEALLQVWGYVDIEIMGIRRNGVLL